MTERATSDERRVVLEGVASRVLELPADRVGRVGIDGVDGAGKTSMADELAEVLAPSGRPVIRASVDGFHNPRAVRYRLGADSPEGFYRDSYDYDTLTRVLLDPLSPGGSGRFRRAVFDVDTDTQVDAGEEQAPPNAILLFDGIFLHRPELRDYWDLSVFLRVDWLRNHHLRHVPADDPMRTRQNRYLEGQNIYLRACRPWELASIVIDNHDLGSPFVVRD
ncbi:MAG TPA: uridine kinase [Actinomycetota bacterium]|nr:uridine kinase [Actinomycetota bacterium]